MKRKEMLEMMISVVKHAKRVIPVVYRHDKNIIETYLLVGL